MWTTTPWTLVSNVALAVNPELTYVALKRKKKDEPPLILAETRAAAVLGDDYTDRWEIESRFPGTDLVGLTYTRPLDWLPYPPGKNQIIVGETFVSAEDGSGVVHMAPAFGADDFAAGQRHGLSLLHPVDDRRALPGRSAAGRREIREGGGRGDHRGAEAARSCSSSRARSSIRIRTAGAATRRCCITRASRGS